MKRIVTMLMVFLGGLVLISCGDASVAPKKTDAAPPNTATTTAPASSANAEADIKKMLNDVATALSKNDADALDKIYAPDYTLVTQDGSVQTRAERLGAIKSGDIKYESFAYSDTTIRTYGDSAVVNTIATFKASNKGKDISGKYRVSSTWIKGKDGWRQVNAQATQIAEPSKTDAVKTDDMKKDDMKKDEMKKDDVKKEDDKK